MDAIPDVSGVLQGSAIAGIGFSAIFAVVFTAVSIYMFFNKKHTASIHLLNAAPNYVMLIFFCGIMWGQFYIIRNLNDVVLGLGTPVFITLAFVFVAVANFLWFWGICESLAVASPAQSRKDNGDQPDDMSKMCRFLDVTWGGTPRGVRNLSMLFFPGSVGARLLGSFAFALATMILFVGQFTNSNGAYMYFSLAFPPIVYAGLVVRGSMNRSDALAKIVGVLPIVAFIWQLAVWLTAPALFRGDALEFPGEIAMVMGYSVAIYGICAALASLMYMTVVESLASEHGVSVLDNFFKKKDEEDPEAGELTSATKGPVDPVSMSGMQIQPGASASKPGRRRR